MSRKTDPFAIDLTPELIVRAYHAGIFPMAEDASSPDVFWVSPKRRGILPLDSFHVSTSLRKAMRSHNFQLRVDTDFPAVIEGCATAGTDRESTWINPTLRDLYGQLFTRGICHTVEVWDGDAPRRRPLRPRARRRVLRRVDVPPRNRRQQDRPRPPRDPPPRRRLSRSATRSSSPTTSGPSAASRFRARTTTSAWPTASPAPPTTSPSTVRPDAFSARNRHRRRDGASLAPPD